VFTRGTTEGLNLIARAWGEAHLGPGDEILASPQEHHSNFLPWQELARRTGATIRWMPLAADGTVDARGPQPSSGGARDSSRWRTSQTCSASRTRWPRSLRPPAGSGALTVLDGAQSVPTRPVDVAALGCDALAFSGHKMLGPTGIGALAVRPDLLDAMAPFQTGGGMIQRAAMDSTDYLTGYARFEAGTPHGAGAIGLAAACDYLSALTYEGTTGMEAVAAYEQAWGERAVEQVAGSRASASSGRQRAGTRREGSSRSRWMGCTPTTSPSSSTRRG
jgi:cysteine desulfurase / selenocysteine lyase